MEHLANNASFQSAPAHHPQNFEYLLLRFRFGVICKVIQFKSALQYMYMYMYMYILLSIYSREKFT